MKFTKYMVLITLVIVYATTYVMEPLEIRNIYLKNILLFIIIGMISYSILNFVLKTAIETYGITGLKETLFQGIKVLLFACILVFVSSVQIGMIEYNNKPISKGCTFYDDYGNIIYENFYNNGCATLEYSIYEDDQIEFSVVESYDDLYENFSFFESEEQFHNVNYHVKRLFTVKIDYDEQHRIIKASVHSSYFSDYENDDMKKNHFGTTETIVTNTYKDSFEQVIEERSVHYDEDGLYDGEIAHFDTSNEEFSVIRYYQNSISEGIYEIRKEYTEGTEPIDSLEFLVTKDGDGYLVRQYLGTTNTEVVKRHEITSEEVIINNVRTTDDEVLDYGKIYSYQARFGMVLSSSSPGNAIYDYRLVDTSDRLYYIESVTRSYSDQTYNSEYIYALHNLEYGVSVERIDFGDISLEDYLFNRDDYNEVYNHVGLYNNSFYNFDSTTVFEITHGNSIYSTDAMIYSKPIFID